ncbi:hypothetical protein FRC08_003177, partial [Ceratobasidium sp. 394]
RLPAIPVDSSSRIPPPPTPIEPEIPAPKIRCVCRSTHDDRGRTIVCEGCGFRRHARCCGLDGEGEVGGRWMCGLCEGGPGGWRKREERAEAKEIKVAKEDLVNDMGGTIVGHGLGEGEGDVGKEAEIGKDRVEVGKELMGVEGSGRKKRKAGRQWWQIAVGLGDEGPVRVDVEMEEAGSEKERAKETETETETDKDKEVLADAQPAIVKVCWYYLPSRSANILEQKKGPPGKSKAPGAGSPSPTSRAIIDSSKLHSQRLDLDAGPAELGHVVSSQTEGTQLDEVRKPILVPHTF